MTPYGLFLAFGMLFTGSTNTLSTKAADLSTAQDRYGNTVRILARSPAAA